MRRTALEKSRTLRVWRNHLATHQDEFLCEHELQPGRFRKSQRNALISKYDVGL
jgi:hypothetical protein